MLCRMSVSSDPRDDYMIKKRVVVKIKEKGKLDKERKGTHSCTAAITTLRLSVSVAVVTLENH